MAEAFASAGHKVTLWTQDWSHAKKARRKVSDSNAAFRLRYVHVPGYGSNICLKRIISHWKFAKNWRREAEQAVDKPQLIVVSSPPLFIGREVQKFSRKHGSKYLVDIMDAWPETFERIVPRWTLFWMRLVVGENYRCASGITAVTKSYLELAQKYGAECKMHLCYHGIQLNDQTTPKRVMDASKERSLKLVYIGNMSLSYDLVTVVEAVKKNGNITLDLAGSGPDEPSLRERASSCSRIRFHGYLRESELRELLASADVGVVPMFDESCVGVPYKLADYAAAGLPVASSLHGETAELLALHKAGITYKAGDIESFSNAVHNASLLDCTEKSLARLFDSSRLYKDYVAFAESAIMPKQLG
jgi:glycosyltransferase involved in cell wall biosynthesis